MTTALYKPKVYTASKLHHFKLWRTLKEDPDWSFVHFTASWINAPEVAAELAGEQPSPETFAEGWLQDIAEVKASDFVLLYAGRENALRGCLIEAGCAIGLGITVLVVGLTDDHTWAYHPGVKRFPNLVEARTHLYKYTTSAARSRR